MNEYKYAFRFPNTFMADDRIRLPIIMEDCFFWAHQYLYGDKIDINLWFNSVTQPANTTGIFINHFLLINGKSKQKINVAVH